MLHIDANNPDQLLNWIHDNLQNDHDTDWYLKSLEEIISSRKANIHDRAYLEEQLLLSKGYRANRLFIIEYDPNSMKYGTCYTICYYKSRGNHNGTKGNDFFWFDSNFGIHGPYMILDDIKKYIYDLWKDSGSTYPYLEFSISINSKPGMNLDEYIKSIEIDEPYDPRFISGQYIYGPTQKELPNDFPIYGLVNHSTVARRMSNKEYLSALIDCKHELEFYKEELSELIRSRENRPNWTIGQLIEKWKRICRQIDTSEYHIEAIRSAPKEYECYRFNTRYDLDQYGENMYKEHISDMINSKSVLTNIAFPRTRESAPATNISYEIFPIYGNDLNEVKYERQFLRLAGLHKNDYIEELRACEPIQLNGMLSLEIKRYLKGRD